MLTVLGQQIDFDITSPADIQRYLAAGEAMEQAAAGLPPMPDGDALQTPDGLRAYAAYLNGQCKLLTDFIDAAFGDGTCNALLGPKTSLDRLMDVVDALREAVTAQGQRTSQKIAAYLPNRATRRKAGA